MSAVASGSDIAAGVPLDPVDSVINKLLGYVRLSILHGMIRYAQKYLVFDEQPLNLFP